MGYDYNEHDNDDCENGYCPECLDECMGYDEDESWFNEQTEHHVYRCEFCGKIVVLDLDLTKQDDLIIPPYEG